MKTTPVQKQVGEFLDYLKNVKKRRAATIEHYRFYLNRFLNWAKLETIDSLSQQKITNYRPYLSQQKFYRCKKLKSTTQNYYLIALRSFLRYLRRNGLINIATEKIKLTKPPKRIIPQISQNDLNNLLAAPEQTNHQEIIKLRDRTLLELLLNGLRISEIAKLKKPDINLKNLLIITAKRKINLTHSARHWLNYYLAARTDNAPYLFICHDRAQNRREAKNGNNPLTPRSIQRIVKAYGQKANLNVKITPQKFRYYYAANQIKQGADAKTLHQMLGHQSLATTKIYLKENNSI